jgi:hypothetical protein
VFGPSEDVLKGVETIQLAYGSFGCGAYDNATGCYSYDKIKVTIPDDGCLYNSALAHEFTHAAQQNLERTFDTTHSDPNWWTLPDSLVRIANARSNALGVLCR